MEFKNYNLLDEVEIGPYTFKVSINQGTDKYFLLGKNCDEEQLFKYLRVEKKAYVMNIVGHEYGGNFPEVKTLEDLNKVIKRLQIDCLIKEAEEKYPVGTAFKSMFSKFNYTSSGKFEWVHRKQLIRDSEIYGVVWNQNEWAEIIQEESEQQEINTYGLKVGDEFPAKMLIEWAKCGENRQQKDQKGGKWHKRNSNFIGDRTIESFKNIDGVVGFLVSGKYEVYLRAEGFKEFAEGFNKSNSAFEFEVGKWYKCEGYNYAIKYLKKEVRNSKYAIVYSDIITHDYRYKSFPEGSTGVGYVDEGTWYELTDLSEIQQYLPDGHPDKIIKQPEYIVGKWYRLGAWIAKFKELDGDIFRVFKSGIPFDNYKSSNNGYLLINHQELPILITDMTEVYKLFPEEKPDDSDLELERWYEDGDFIVYLYARNSVYGFHHDYWFESNGFNEKGLKLCHPQKVDDKFSKYIRNEYKIGDIVTCPYDQQIFKIKKLDFNVRKDRVVVSASNVEKSYGFLFYQGAWAEIKSDFIINPCTEICNTLTPSYEEWIKENSSKQESTTELLLKLNNKKQKFVKLTEVKTIKL